MDDSLNQDETGNSQNEFLSPQSNPLPEFSLEENPSSPSQGQNHSPLEKEELNDEEPFEEETEEMEEMEVEVFSNKTGQTQTILKSEINNEKEEDAKAKNSNRDTSNAANSWSAANQNLQPFDVLPENDENDENDGMVLKKWQPGTQSSKASGDAYQALRKTVSIPKENLTSEKTTLKKMRTSDVIPEYIGLNNRSMVVFLFNRESKAVDLSRLEESLDYMDNVDVAVLDFYGVSYLLPSEVGNMNLIMAKIRANPVRVMLSNCNQDLRFQMEQAGISSDLEFLL